MAAVTIRLGPVDIRDPRFRNRAQRVQRAQLVNVLWSDPTKLVVYISGLTDAAPDSDEPPGISIEGRVQDMILLHRQLGALLASGGFLKPRAP